MKGLGNRLRSLRESTMMSQAKFAKEIGSSQSAINRFENDQSEPNCTLMLRYADYFNVSMDYLYGRMDRPEGMTYEFKPKFDTNNEQFKQFIEMCFDPQSPLNAKLKQSLFDLMDKSKEHDN